MENLGENFLFLSLHHKFPPPPREKSDALRRDFKVHFSLVNPERGISSFVNAEADSIRPINPSSAHSLSSPSDFSLSQSQRKKR